MQRPRDRAVRHNIYLSTNITHILVIYIFQNLPGTPTRRNQPRGPTTLQETHPPLPNIFEGGKDGPHKGQDQS